VNVRARATLFGLAICVSCTVVPASGPPPTTSSRPATPPIGERAARQAVRSFLAAFMNADGRVIRVDQGRDTVSEGQAYAMLLAVAVDDADVFARAWGWARAHLQRPDGLLSWHWVNGSVADPQSAADADVIAAWALDLASQRFHTPTYQAAARTMARSILSKETIVYGGGRLLVAGPWARAEPAWIDPSYFTPAAFADLAKLDGGFGALQDGSARALRTLTAHAPHLPPDWATHSGTELRASSSPDGQSPRYGYDAVRVPLWMSISCRAADRAIAAAMWGFLSHAHGRVYALNGRPLDPTSSSEALVAAAAAARAAGDTRDVPLLLDKAQHLDSAQPRYYASALIALGRVLLATTLLDTC